MKKHSKQFWVSVEDQTNDPSLVEASRQEFHGLPVFEEEKTIGKASTSRRDFLKYLGFSVGAATAAAACEIPVRKAVPWVVKPDTIVPGVATYYASTFVDGGDCVPILVKTREGRPIKIEGNTMSSFSGGGTSARVQASVLSLYDTHRFREPGKIVDNKSESITWDELDQEIKSKLNAESKVRIISGTVTSPTTRKAIEEFLQAFPAGKWIQWDAVSSDAILEANDSCFGYRTIPNYKFDQAEVIVSFDADFLGTWISPVEYAAAYAKNRKIKDVNNAVMSRHVQVESMMSLTGSNADNRILVKPSEQGAAIAILYNEIASLKGGIRINAPDLNDAAVNSIKKVASDLARAEGKSLVVSGSNNAGEQVLVNAINDLLGNYGSTISWQNASLQRQGSDRDLQDCISDMSRGSVDAVFFMGANPAYEAPNADEFASALEKVGLKVSFALGMDETTALCDYAAPSSHYLESWGDAEPKKGHLSLIQPTIAPLFKSRQAEASLLIWADSPNYNGQTDQPFYEYLKSVWENEMFSQQNKFSSFSSFWDSTLHDGVLTLNDDTSSPSFSGDVRTASSRIGRPANAEWEISFYETVNMGAGQYANNPWLMEMPDPLTRAVWGNYLLIPIKWDGKKNYTTYNNLNDGDRVVLEVNGSKQTVTVVRQFGQAPGTASLALGYGRTNTGSCGRDVGINVNPWLSTVDGNTQYFATNVSIGEKVGEEEDFACVQHHHTLGVTGTVDGSDAIVNVDEIEVMSLGKGYQGGLTDRSILFTTHVDDVKSYAEELHHKREHFQELNDHTLYPDYSDIYSNGHHWGMHIDLNACTGCGACTVACMAENNVPVVGKREVYLHHEMPWLRIDRYFYGDVHNPNVAYQPMMCQHCDSAPCENVCPVAATNHSSEGINQMAYNRCIGTRYCANNCPYKVRRFNWLDYTTADLFPSNEYKVHEEEIPFGADNLTRMVLNPDVTVRSRGVMEKCSFCVQRIQEGKLTAKIEGRTLRDSDVRSACQTACPTGAITFGDMNNKKGDLVSKLKNPLNYEVLEEVNTRPSVTYTAKVNNKDESLEA